MNFNFSLPTEIIFGGDCVERLPEIIKAKGYKVGVLVCGPFIATTPVCKRIMQLGNLVAVYSDVQPNPTVDNVDACASLLKETGADFVVALGGGSSMDCAKAACAICKTDDSIRLYHTGGKSLSQAPAGIDLIAVPTTSGTGSEVTWVSVLSDPEKGIKAPLGDRRLLPKIAMVDYKLTLSAPPRVTASTGVDVLSHAIEGYWSKDHQPFCDAMAIQATKLVFEYLPRAYDCGSDEEAREQMSLASLMAGVAFGHPKTTGSHACSFPLTNLFHVPHGEACAFTLDYFIRINADCQNGRVQNFARCCGFEDANALADAVAALKKRVGLRTTLSEIGVADDFIPELSRLSQHPNMLNNPVNMSLDAIETMYRALR